MGSYGIGDGTVLKLVEKDMFSGNIQQVVIDILDHSGVSLLSLSHQLYGRGQSRPLKDDHIVLIELSKVKLTRFVHYILIIGQNLRLLKLLERPQKSDLGDRPGVLHKEQNFHR